MLDKIINSTIGLEFQVIKLTKIVEWLVNHNTQITKPSVDIIASIDAQVSKELLKKYPVPFGMFSSVRREHDIFSLVEKTAQV